MKPQLTLIMALLFALNSWGQSLSEKEAVLKKCIELPQVQEVLSENMDNKVYVMQHSVSLDSEINLKNSDQELVLMSKKEIHNQNVDTFLLFEKFNITLKEADIEFFVYQDFRTSSKTDKVTLQMTKVNSNWTISSKNHERK